MIREFEIRSGTDRGRALRVKGTLKGGRYELIDVFADGGMGVIFRARDLRVGGNVVLIKSVKYDPSMFGYDKNAALYHIYAMRQHFKREKNVLMELQRRGINAVPALNDFFFDENPEWEASYPFGRLSPREPLRVGQAQVMLDVSLEPYMVLERIFGTTLKETVANMSEARLLEVAVSICRTIGKVHAARTRRDGRRLSFIYMDLKPDNLLIDKQGGVTLVDFGGAIPVVDGGRRSKGAYTPGYAAPEVRRLAHPDAQVDHRADIYSIGAILFYGLSKGNVDPMRLATELEDEFPILDAAHVRDDTNPLTKHVVRKALSRDPASRYASIRELELALEAALRDQRQVNPAAHP